MKQIRKALIPIFLATAWIGTSEFIRNEFLLKTYWVDHYDMLGLTFPSELINGAVWGLWSLLFAITVYILSTRFNLFHTALLSWFVGFVLMWVVIWNLDVLPPGLLIFAIPLSLLEAFVATWIIYRTTKKAT